MRRKDQTETSIVTWKPARGTSVTRPPSASLVEKAIEWTRKSSSPHSAAIRSKTASSWPSAITSIGMKIGASTSRASGSTCGFAFSLR